MKSVGLFLIAGLIGTMSFCQNINVNPNPPINQTAAVTPPPPQNINEPIQVINTGNLPNTDFGNEIQFNNEDISQVQQQINVPVSRGTNPMNVNRTPQNRIVVSGSAGGGAQVKTKKHTFMKKTRHSISIFFQKMGDHKKPKKHSRSSANHCFIF